MATTRQSINPQLLELIGAIVVSTQDAERYLKVILPFTNAQDPSLSGAISRREKLKKRTLGDLVGTLVDSSTQNSERLKQHLTYLVEQRNRVIHHFGETYGQQLRSGNSHQVLESLKVLLANVDAFRAAMEEMALRLFEAMRDTTFHGTPEYEEFAELCATFRRSLGR